MLKQEKFELYVPESRREILEAFERELSDNLVEFNQDKENRIQQLLDSVPELNIGENLQHLYAAGLLDPETYRMLNHALFYIYFSSVDYKPPEKKKPEEDAENNQDQDAPEEQKEPAEEEGDKPADAENEQPAQEEEEWKAPDVSEEELQIVKAKEKLSLVFVEDPAPEGEQVEHDSEPLYEAVLRMRVPIDRELNTSKSIDTHRSSASKKSFGSKGSRAHDRAAAARQKKTSNIDIIDEKHDKKNAKKDSGLKSSKLHAEKPKEIEESKHEEVEEQPPREPPTWPEDFIEPYSGETFELERGFFPGTS